MPLNDPEPWHDGIWTWPLGGETAQAFGHLISKEFEAMFAFLDEDTEGIWLVYFQIQVTQFGTPEILRTEIMGSSIKAKDGLNFDTRTIQQPDTEKVERWQLKYVEQNLTELLRRATMHFAEKWEEESGPMGGWKRAYGPYERYFTDDERKTLKKSLEKRLHQKITPEFLQKVSDIYLGAVKESSKPTKAVAEYFGKDIKTAQSWVKKARDQKILPATSRGKVSRGKFEVLEIGRKKAASPTQKQGKNLGPRRTKLSDPGDFIKPVAKKAIRTKKSAGLKNEASSSRTKPTSRREKRNV